MFYHTNKAKGSSVPSNFTVSWSSFFSTSAARKRDHLAVIRKSSASPADEEVSGVITCSTFRNKTAFQGSANKWTERATQEEMLQIGLQTNFPWPHLLLLHTKRQKPLPSPEDHLPDCGQYRDFKKWPSVLGSSVLKAQAIRFMICRRQFLIICDNQAPVSCWS